MSKVSLSNTSGKLFWGSLFGYCLTFTAFHFNTQYALGKLETEMRSGPVFDVIRHTACEQTKGCKVMSYLPYLSLNTETGKYKVQIAVDLTNPKDINSALFNELLEAKRGEFPWYVNNKLDSIEVAVVNGNKVVAEPAKPEWYLSLISTFG